MDNHRNPDGTYRGIGVLGELTGLGGETVQKLADHVKANHSRLMACRSHDFETINPDVRLGRQRYRCIHCNGEVDFHAYHWHEIGRRSRSVS